MSKNFIESVKSGADHVVGDLFLGTIGQIGFHAAQLPVVGTGLRYVGENVADGYNEAKERAQIKKGAAALVSLTRQAGKDLNEVTIRNVAKEMGISEEQIEKMRQIAESQMRPARPGTQPFPAPAIAG